MTQNEIEQKILDLENHINGIQDKFSILQKYMDTHIKYHGEEAFDEVRINKNLQDMLEYNTRNIY